MSNRIQKFGFLATLVLFTSLAFAQSQAERVQIQNPWVRLNAPGTQVTGAFMLLGNPSDKEIRLVKAESQIAKVTELHNHVNEGGVMKMRQVPLIAVPAKGEAALKPGSYHVMLIDLKAPLQEGGTVPITLEFEDGSTQIVHARVTRPTAEKHAH